MPITEAIILAGGMGTRLRSAVPDMPKCLAPAAGRPFLHYVIYYLQQQGIRRFIFSLGWMSSTVVDYIKAEHPLIDAVFAVEQEPLGTGGAIQLACSFATTPDVLVVNGDTLFKADTAAVAALHRSTGAACTLALKPMHNFDRYGTVVTAADDRILRFEEKQPMTEGLISGGVYLLHTAALKNAGLPQQFSFEKDYLEKFSPAGNFYGQVQDTYFIDIGIPEDFERAGRELAVPPGKENLPAALAGVNKSWTLFLDRDGVINHEKHKDYIHSKKEFLFYPGVKEALKLFAAVFGHIIVVTNQKGVGKGLTRKEDLLEIHRYMQAEAAAAGGRIDQVYWCGDLDDNSPDRKPNPGMGHQAKAAYPDIDFSKAVMVGNTLSDMEFGRNLGVTTIFLTTTRPDTDTSADSIDMVCSSLLQFAEQLPLPH